MIPYEIGDNYLNAFGKMGCTNIGLMHIRNRVDVGTEDYQQRIEKCDAVLFSGGNQNAVE
jgi:cyanophycinase